MENQLHFHLSGKKELTKIKFEKNYATKNKIRNINYPGINLLIEYKSSK